MIVDIDHFGEWQRTQRVAHKLSQQQLGLAVGVSTYSIWAYENGKKNPTLFTMLCIAQYFGYDLQLNIMPSEKKQIA